VVNGIPARTKRRGLSLLSLLKKELTPSSFRSQRQSPASFSRLHRDPESFWRTSKVCNLIFATSITRRSWPPLQSRVGRTYGASCLTPSASSSPPNSSTSPFLSKNAWSSREKPHAHSKPDQPLSFFSRFSFEHDSLLTRNDHVTNQTPRPVLITLSVP
jgi:hypothetical protein